MEKKNIVVLVIGLAVIGGAAFFLSREPEQKPDPVKDLLTGAAKVSGAVGNILGGISPFGGGSKNGLGQALKGATQQ